MSYLDAKPTIGRIVHFKNDEAVALYQPFAAIITLVHPDTDGDVVDLTVFPPGRPPFVALLVAKALSPHRTNEHRWMWPPRDLA